MVFAPARTWCLSDVLHDVANVVDRDRGESAVSAPGFGTKLIAPHSGAEPPLRRRADHDTIAVELVDPGACENSPRKSLDKKLLNEAGLTWFFGVDTAIRKAASPDSAAAHSGQPAYIAKFRLIECVAPTLHAGLKGEVVVSELLLGDRQLLS